MELETINRLYLELSQFATAKTAREIALEKQIAELQATAQEGMAWLKAFIKQYRIDSINMELQAKETEVINIVLDNLESEMLAAAKVKP